MVFHRPADDALRAVLRDQLVTPIPEVSLTYDAAISSGRESRRFWRGSDRLSVLMESYRRQCLALSDGSVAVPLRDLKVRATELNGAFGGQSLVCMRTWPIGPAIVH